MALNFVAPDDVIMERISGRRTCNKCGATYHIKNDPPEVEGVCDKCGGEVIQRSDDQEETVKKRIEVNKAKTAKLADYYQNKGILHEVESIGGIDKVQQRLMKLIEANK